jgi:chromatin remodeling complex protein RSC6
MQPMLKRGVALSDKRFEEMQKIVLQTLKPPGLRPIKQVELYKKFCPYVPRQYWDETCPKPSDEVLESVRKERADKRKTKNNNDAEKKATKERKKTEAAEKKKKAAAERAKKKGRQTRGHKKAQSRCR